MKSREGKKRKEMQQEAEDEAKREETIMREMPQIRKDGSCWSQPAAHTTYTSGYPPH
jgi:hypothetical protein